MKVSVARELFDRMAQSGDLYVKDMSGRWHYVTDIQCSGMDTIYPPTTMTFDGVVYVREEDAELAARVQGQVA